MQDLEEISKLESGMLVLDQERFDIVALVHEIADAVEMEATAPASPSKSALAYPSRPYMFSPTGEESVRS
ncbi:MAG: hypothetical protein ACLR8Y_05275 [Alistipes indistinctus]